MVNEKEQYERAQDYLLGRMSEEDRAAFESELKADTSLRRRVEELSSLAKAVTRVNQEIDLFIALEEAEERLSSSEKTKDRIALDAELDGVERELQFIGRFSPSRDETVSVPRTISFARIRRIAITCVAAASLLVFGSLGYLSYNAHSVGMGYQLSIDNSRGADPITDLINNGDYSGAQKGIAETKENLEKTREEFANKPAAYQYYCEQIEYLDLLDAVCELRQWHYFSAKKKLKAIVNNDGIYKEDAQQLLNNL